VLNYILSFAPQLKFGNSRVTYLLFLEARVSQSLFLTCRLILNSSLSAPSFELRVSLCLIRTGVRFFFFFHSELQKCRIHRHREREKPDIYVRRLTPCCKSLRTKFSRSLALALLCLCRDSDISGEYIYIYIYISLSLSLCGPLSCTVLRRLAIRGTENGNCGSGARGAVEEDDSSVTAARQLHPKEPEKRTTSSSGTVVFMAKTARTKATELAETASGYGIRHGHCACGRNLHVRLRFRGFGLVSGLVRTPPRRFRRRE
jgi:hypothetical protein